MASQDSIKRAVLSKISAAGSVGGRNPISTLCSAVEANNKAGKQLVEWAVNDLEREGKISIKYHNDGRINRIYALRPRRHVDRTEMTSQQKREAMFAKGVSPFLRDDQCGPVTISHRESRPKEVSATVDTPQPNQSEETAVSEYTKDFAELPLHEQVTLALMALQEVADKDGSIYCSSTAKVIADKLEIPIGFARSLNKRLFHLGLRKSVSGPGAGVTRPHWVSMDVKELTAQTINSFGSDESSHKLGSESVDDEVASKLVEIIKTLEQTQSDLQAELDQARAEAAKLVEIVKILEQKLAERDDVVAKASVEIDSLREHVSRLKVSEKTLKEEAAKLKSQLETRRSGNPEIQAILERHNKS